MTRAFTPVVCSALLLGAVACSPGDPASAAAADPPATAAPLLGDDPAAAQEGGGAIRDDGAGAATYAPRTSSVIGAPPEPQLAALLVKKEGAAALAAGDPAGADIHGGALTETEETLQRAARRAPGEDVDLIIDLGEPGFPFHRLRQAEAGARAELLAARRQQLAPAQEPIIDRLRALGATGVGGFLLVNHLAARVRAGDVARIARWPEVRGLARGNEPVRPQLAYTGVETRSGLKHGALISAGIHGGALGRSGGPIRIGVVDAGRLVSGHVGFSPGRIARNYDCRSGTCVAGAPAGASPNHGSTVTAVAAGSIEGGQDPAVPSGYDRLQRSGAAPRASIYYYDITGTGSTGIKRGIDQAVADGVDVINYSGAVVGYECQSAANVSLINDSIKAATDAGVLVVAAAGNHDPALGGACVSYPALRSEVLAAGALDTGDTAVAYDGAPMAAYSNTGPVPLRTFTGVSSTMAGVGLVTPGTYSLLDYTGTSGYGTTSPFAGTSFASPTLAGVAGLLRHGYNAVGFAGNDARVLLVSMLLMGDAWNPATGGVLQKGGSPIAGQGRAHMHWPSGTNLAGPWGWGYHWKLLAHHETWTIPIGGGPLAGVRQWKGAVLWTEPDLNNAADIDVSVYDKGTDCRATPTLVAAQTDYDLRNRLQLRDAAVSGRCLEMRIYGYNVPAGGRAVYTSDYYHGGTPD